MFTRLQSKKILSAIAASVLVIGISLQPVVTYAGPIIIQPMCEYPAPPMGCNYVPGPEYDPSSGCGMVLSCDGDDSDPIPLNTTETIRVNVSTQGDEANGGSWPIAMTPNARYVLFQSSATNLVPHDTNRQPDVFVRDTVNNTTTLVSTTLSGIPGNGSSQAKAITPDGRYVLFESDADDFFSYQSQVVIDGGMAVAHVRVPIRNVYLRDMQTGNTRIVSQPDGSDPADGQSDAVGVTSNGRYVMFNSSATNLTPGADNNNVTDVYVKDMLYDTIDVVSANIYGVRGNGASYGLGISDDGLYLSYVSDATNLTRTSDTNGKQDVFVLDLYHDNVSRLTVPDENYDSNEYAYGTNMVTPDGKNIIFTTNSQSLGSYGNNDVFVWNWPTNGMKIASPNFDELYLGSNAYSEPVAMSPNGRYVLYYNEGNDQVDGGNANSQGDGYLRDMQQTTTMNQIGKTYNGQTPDGYTYPAAVTPDGKYVAFYSSSSNLIANDNNGQMDAFVRDIAAGTTTRVGNAISLMANGGLGPQPVAEPNSYSYATAISSDGKSVLIFSDANNLVVGDNNGLGDIFLVRPTSDVITPPVTTNLYTSPDGGFEFHYPSTLGYKHNTTTPSAALLSTFTVGGKVFDGSKPLITVSQGPTDKTLLQLQNSTKATYRKLFRENFTLSSEIDTTADGVGVKKMTFTGKIAGKNKTFIVAYIRSAHTIGEYSESYDTSGINSKYYIYVISANADAEYATDLDAAMDTMVSTWKSNLMEP